MHFAVRLRVVAAYVAQMLVAVSLLSVLPLAVMVATGCHHRTDRG